MKTQVIIVGAGPAGLCLALSLAKFNIQSVILEKRAKITSDPRGVYLTGDAVRILCHLGIAEDLADIGHNARFVKFHQSSYSAPTLLTLNAGASNALQQAVPEGLLQMQPRLERALRRKIKASPYIKLLLGCEVTAMIAQEPPTIEYINASDAVRRITGQWLIGADGKAGIVRKYFLEPIAGIKQQPGTHFYDGTSIASNLKITLPTPQSHPRFPLWALGYSPEEVYDLFWPEGWHFCFPPGKPTAGGRFGPHHERLWRHEFRHEDGIASQRDAEMLFWDHLLPMITLGGDKIKGLYGHNMSVQFPRDCINILRCRPFRFTHKVVNQWFHGRTVLIGDAAHVFPPFAGQGIASGMRDAHQLAWRLSLLIHQCPVQLNIPMAPWATELLQSWAEERRHSVDHTAGLSVGIGHMLQKPPPAMARLGFKMKSGIDRSSARLANAIDPLANNERRGFRDVKEGFFVKNLRGGARLAQIYLESWLTGQRVLSDSILSSSPSAFTLIVIANQWNSVTTRVCKATIAVQNASLHPSVLTEDSIVVYYNPDREEESDENGGSSTHKEADLMQLYQPHVLDPLAPESTRCGGYDAQAYLSRLGSKTKFALVRADFFVFACAKTYSQLLSSLSQLQGRLSDETAIV